MKMYARFGTMARVAGLSAVLVAAGVIGCHKTSAQDSGAAGTDPADANLAPVNGAYAPAAQNTSAAQPARVLGQRAVNEAQQQAQDYTPQQAAAPIERRSPGGDPYDATVPQQGYDPGAPAASYADQAADEYAADLTTDAAAEPPPPLPDYDQPPCPDPDYLWTPGYWGWGSAGYYWVPGVWVAAPYSGALWTPGYWGFVGGRYRFHHGFWGSHIGFYGGINYGFGYVGYGYYGGYWRDRHFVYNTAVNRVNVNVVRNVYVRNVVVNNVVINNRIENHVSYNGGRGGIAVRPRPAEIAVLHEERIPPMQAQLAVRHQAEGNRAQFFQENHGRPQMAVVARPVAADRSLPAPLPRITTPVQNGPRGGELRFSQQPAGQPAPAVQTANPAALDLAHGRIERQEQPGRQGQPQPQPAANLNGDHRGPWNGQPAVAPNVQTMQQHAPAPAVQPAPQPQAQPHPRPAYQPPPAQANAPQYRQNNDSRGQPQPRFENRAVPAAPPTPQPAPRIEPPAQPHPQVQVQQPHPQPPPPVQQPHPQPQAHPAPPPHTEPPHPQPQQREDRGHNPQSR